MNKEERLQLENECLIKHSKAQMIQKYIDELEESSKLSELWCKSQEENKKYKEVIDKAIEYLEKSKLNQLDTYCKYLYIDFDTGKIENIDELLKILKGESNE